MRYQRFSDCSISEKLLDSLFIVLLGIGYLFAMVMLYVTVAPEDGKPGLSPADIVIKYHGNRSGTRLGAALTGKMEVYRTPDEYTSIVTWIHNGAGKPEYDREVSPILARKCLSCHSPTSGLDIPDLSSYEKLMPMVQVDTGESFGVLVKVSHIHLFGVSIMFYLLGRIFILSEMPAWLKRTIVAIPFIAIVMDIGSWWLTRYANIFSYTVLIGGGLTGVSFAIQAFTSLYQMWIYKPKTQN